MSAPTFIGIAGGSGTGKSTLVFALLERHPEKLAIVHLDDYFQKRKRVPTVENMTNWDHPDAIRWDDLVHDLNALRSGQPIEVFTKSERLNPEYRDKGKRRVTVQPKPVILVEGFLALWHPQVRAFFAATIYLEIHDEAIRLLRRALHRQKFRARPQEGYDDDAYVEKVLLPMHKQFLYPTKQFADHVLDVTDMTPREVADRAEFVLEDFL